MSKLGRPTTYDTETDGEICERMADGEGLRAVCRDEHMPAESTVRGWVLDGVEGTDERQNFSAQYARAEQLRAMRWADEIVDIADDSSNDLTQQEGDGQSGGANHEHINRSRLRVDTRKWLLSKVLPKVYGDKMKVGAEEGGSVTFTMNIAGGNGDQACCLQCQPDAEPVPSIGCLRSRRKGAGRVWQINGHVLGNHVPRPQTKTGGGRQAAQPVGGCPQYLSGA